VSPSSPFTKAYNRDHALLVWLSGKCSAMSAWIWYHGRCVGPSQVSKVVLMAPYVKGSTLVKLMFSGASPPSASISSATCSSNRTAPAICSPANPT